MSRDVTKSSNLFNKTITFDLMEEHFDAAAERVAAIAGSLPEPTLLEFYGLFKQATEGRCTIKKPSILDFKGRAKHAAWASLGDVPSDKAKLQYVQLLTRLKPDWLETKNASSSAVGPVFSSLEMLDGYEEQVRSGLNFLRCLSPPLSLFRKYFRKLTWCDGMQDTDFPRLIVATQEEDINRIECVLQEGDDPNARDQDGCTALHWAADKGNKTIIEKLLEAGADAQAKDADGLTPKEYAEVAEKEHVLELL